jgi:hypothetical protein
LARISPGHVDHQTGLLSLVSDSDPDKFKNKVLAVASCRWGCSIRPTRA